MTFQKGIYLVYTWYIPVIWPFSSYTWLYLENMPGISHGYQGTWLVQNKPIKFFLGIIQSYELNGHIPGIYQVYTRNITCIYELNGHMTGIYQIYTLYITCLYLMFIIYARLKVLLHRISCSASCHTQLLWQPSGQPLPGPHRRCRHGYPWSTGFDGCLHGWAGQGKWLWL